MGTKSRFLCGNIESRFDKYLILIVLVLSSEISFFFLKSQSKEPESLGLNIPDLT